MTILARWRSWFRAILRRADVERATRRELEFHVAQYAEDLRRSGVPAEEARRRSRAEFGSIAARTEECREALGVRLFDELRADVRYAVRLLWRSPAFASVAVLSLALGIGANTAVFSLIDTILLKSLPVEDPDRLVFIDGSGRSGGSTACPYPCFELLRDHNRHFTGMAAFNAQRLQVSIDGPAEQITGQYASGNYFELLGVRPVIGRVLTAADDSEIGRGGKDGAVGVISYALWKGRFGMSPAVLGKTIRVGTTPVTIVGVTPAEFFGVNVGSRIDVTVPMALSGDDLRAREMWWFSAIGRLNDAASVEQARADLDAMFQAYLRDIGMTGSPRNNVRRIALVPAARGLDGLRREFSQPLAIASGIVGLVLLIGCANLANLLLARGTARRSEFAIRLAIGAGRSRVMRQLVTEGVVLVTLAAGVGLLFAWWSTTLLTGLAAGVRDRIVLEPRLDARVLSFTASVAVLTCLLFSLVPALQTTRVDAAKPDDIGRTGARKPSVRAGQAFVVAQVTASLVLLCIAGLFVRTLQNLNAVDTGFQREDVLTMQVDATLPTPAPAADEEGSRIGSLRMWSDLVSRVTTLPGVRAVGAATLVPLTGRDRRIPMRVRGTRPDKTIDPRVQLNQVTDAYFTVTGIRLQAGRLFSDRDGPQSPKVAILNERAARVFFGTSSPIGQHVIFRDREFEIVGVVHDTRYQSVRREAGPMVYVPMPQSLDRIGSIMLAVSTTGDARSLATAIRSEVAVGVPNGFVRNVATMEQLIDESLLRERLLSMLATFFGALALVLACIGLYGVLAYAVVQRTREIGIRLAVGAQHRSVIWLVLRDTLGLIAIGVVLGLLALAGAGRYIESQLFDVQPGDPIAITAAVALLLGVAAAAGFLPALRATRVDPIVALRYE